MLNCAKWKIIWSNNEFDSLNNLHINAMEKITVEDHLKAALLQPESEGSLGTVV